MHLKIWLAALVLVDLSYGGGFRDYTLYSLKVPSITVEIGSVSCPVPYSYMPTIFRQNKYVILREAALFL